MIGTLPINLHDLLTQRNIESERVEYRTGWNPQSVPGRHGAVSMTATTRRPRWMTSRGPKILRAMRKNGSPAAVFESDDDRTWFLVRFPVHAAHGAPTVQGTEQGHERVDGQVTEHETEQDTEQDAPQVMDHVGRLVAALTSPLGRAELQAALNLRTDPTS